jgi:chemotaxis protein histidine kinase CheA
MNEVVIPLKIQGIAQMKAELKELKGAIASATDPAQMAALAQQAGVLSDKIKDTNDAVNVFASGSKFEQVSNGLGGIKSSLMSLDFEEAAEKSKTFATALGGIGKADIAKSMKGIVDMTKTLTGAFLKLGMTILMNPIFLIVAAVVAIIAVVALVLKSFGVLDDVIKAMMMPINMLIEGFKALTDWLGLTAFAAEENAAKTLAANEKVTESSKERTASLTADLGREIAEAKAAGEDTTKLEQEKSNVQIKEADKRRGTAYKALAAQRKLGEDADQETIKKLKKQINEENEIIKQGYSDKKIAKLNDIKADEEAAKKAAEKQKAANDKYAAADKASMEQIAAAKKIVTDSTKTAQQIELDDLAAAYAIKIATAIKYKNDTTALVEGQKIQEAEINKKYADIANAKIVEDNKTRIALEDAHFLEMQRLTLSDVEFKKLQATQAAEAKMNQFSTDAEMVKLLETELAAELVKIQDDANKQKTANLKAETDKQKAIDDAALQAKKSIISSEIDAAKGLVNLLGGLGEKNKKIQKAALIANAALSIAEIINNTNVGTSKEVATKGILGLSTSALLYIKMATSIASVVAATAKGLSALGGGSVTAPSDTGGGGGGGGNTSTTAVAPASGPNLFGQANTGSQVNAGGGSNNITVTAVVSETEITSSQNHINNIQNNSVL